MSAKPSRNMGEIVIGKDAQTPTVSFGSWWICDDAKFAAAQAERQKHSWGQYKDVPVASLTTGENERRHSMGKSTSAFAPSPTRNSVDKP